MTTHDEPCARFEAHLSALLLGDMDAKLAASLTAHRDACGHCMASFHTAAEADGLFASWDAPSPPEQLKLRILQQLVTCALFGRELDAWRCGDLSEGMANLLSMHQRNCVNCAAASETADKVNALLAGWAPPRPAIDLRERTVARIGNTPVGATHRRSALPRLASLAAAAAILVGTMLILHAWSPEKPTPAAPVAEQAGRPALVEPPLNDVLQQRFHNLRVQTVRHRQFPNAIGAFDAQPVLADRSRRKSGNVFHQALRRVIAHGSGTAEER